MILVASAPFRRLVPMGIALVLTSCILYTIQYSGIPPTSWRDVISPSGSTTSYAHLEAFLPAVQPEDRWDPPIDPDHPIVSDVFDAVYTNFTLLDTYASGTETSQIYDTSSNKVEASPYDKKKLEATGFVPCDGERGSTPDSPDSTDEVYANPGKLHNFAKPLLGSTEVVGFEQNACYDRYSRWSPYGLKNSPKTQGAIDWDKVDWADLQDRCVYTNKARFDFTSRANLGRAHTNILNLGGFIAPKSTFKRTAIVFRLWQGATYNQDVRRNMRAVIQELALRTGGEYQAFILLQVKFGYNLPTMSTEEKHQAIAELVPPEFLNITTLWSEDLWSNDYPLVPERERYVHMSQWLPMQMFQKQHPEFDFYWNWEMDVRYTGHWYDFARAADRWSAAQPRKGLWERNERFYIPRLHGSWEQFRDYIQARFTPTGIDTSVWGPQLSTFSPTDAQSSWLPKLQGVQPPVSTPSQDDYSWGVGEHADFVTFLPQFEPSKTNYVLESGWWNYNGRIGGEQNLHDSTIPRRTTIITFSRLSARLLHLMELENTIEPGHHMGSETWPQSLALHYGLKSVSVPHGIYMDRDWPGQAADWVFNNGDQEIIHTGEDMGKVELREGGDGAGGPNSVFGLGWEHNLWSGSWYYEAKLGEKLYKRWLGHEIDGVGGMEWEREHGLYCLPPMLLHPVKNIEDPEGVA